MSSRDFRCQAAGDRAPLGGRGLLVGICLALASCGGDAPPPSFILVSLDTLRADRVGAYGYSRPTTPFLDELAGRGFLFEEAVAPSANTLISHASLLTGLFPRAHGATHLDGGRALDPAYRTLAEDLAAAGYQTGAFAAHRDWISAGFGFSQGFDAFSSDYRAADAVLAEAAAWLQGRDRERPYFLFVHLYDIHSDWEGRPYEAPPPFRGMFTGGEEFAPAEPAASRYLLAVNAGDISIDERQIAALADQYDEGVVYTDDSLGRFLRGLGPEELERTWMVVTADHGEGFLEHGKLVHSTLHDEVVKVPLVLVPPASAADARHTPRRIRRQVSLVDLRPTLLSLAGLPPPEASQGRDLAPCWREDEAASCPERPVPLQVTGLRHQGMKLLTNPGGSQLFDLRLDPGERNDLSGSPEMQDRLRSLEAALERLLAEQERLRETVLGAAEPERADQEAGAEERLRALGYLD